MEKLPISPDMTSIFGRGEGYMELTAFSLFLALSSVKSEVIRAQPS